MRKQYHFWPADEGYDAWDVDRLIELSKDLQARHIPLDAIWELDTVYWFDPETDPPTVRRVVDHLSLVEEVDTRYPIILGPDGRVMDGMHRVARALLEGRSTIKAVQFEELPAPDYRDCHPDDLPYV